jgi:hypothetical protein
LRRLRGRGRGVRGAGGEWGICVCGLWGLLLGWVMVGRSEGALMAGDIVGCCCWKYVGVFGVVAVIDGGTVVADLQNSVRQAWYTV